MNELRPKKSSPASLGGAIGLLIGVCLFVPLYVLTFAAGTEIAAYVFPFAVIANPRFYDPWWLTSALWVAVGGLFITHIIALAGATSRLNAYHEQRWQQIQSRWQKAP
jgi:uncharacterized membrane protein